MASVYGSNEYILVENDFKKLDSKVFEAVVVFPLLVLFFMVVNIRNVNTHTPAKSE